MKILILLLLLFSFSTFSGMFFKSLEYSGIGQPVVSFELSSGLMDKKFDYVDERSNLNKATSLGSQWYQLQVEILFSSFWQVVLEGHYTKTNLESDDVAPTQDFDEISYEAALHLDLSYFKVHLGLGSQANFMLDTENAVDFDYYVFDARYFSWGLNFQSRLSSWLTFEYVFRARHFIHERSPRGFEVISGLERRQTYSLLMGGDKFRIGPYYSYSFRDLDGRIQFSAISDQQILNKHYEQRLGLKLEFGI